MAKPASKISATLRRRKADFASLIGVTKGPHGAFHEPGSQNAHKTGRS
jgi:hypothetical protein